MKHQIRRALAVLLLFSLCLSLLPVSVQAADYIAAEHTGSNGRPYYIMVNRQCNTVTIYRLDENGYYTVPYKAMVCSTGRSGHETPTGTFTTTSLKKRWCYMVDGSYGQYSTQFSGNYLFHSVCYTTASNSALMTDEYNLLGDYASLGCVRLQVEDAKWIYDNIAAGTYVTVYDGTTPGALGKPQKAVSYISADWDCGWEPTDPATGNPWKVTLTASVSSWSSGSGTVSGSGSFLKTNTVTVSASPAQGSIFAGWYDQAGNLLSSSPVYSFILTDSTLVEALFERCYTLKAVASRSGSATGSGSYPSGTSVTLTATPSGSATFSGWYNSSGSFLSSSPAMTVTTGSSDDLYYALFSGDVFVDLPASSWYTDTVLATYARGLFKGETPVTFNPNGTMTRAMAVTVIARLAGVDSADWSSATTTFSDVRAGRWYYGSVCWGTENGIVKGLSSSLFGTDEPVTREQFVTFLMRYVTECLRIELTGADLTFADADTVSPFAAVSCAQACQIGILKGYTDNTLRPKATMTRAEGATLILRLAEWLEAQE